MVFLWLAQGIQSHHLSYYLAVMYVMRTIFLGAFSLTVTFVFQSSFVHSAFLLTEGITFGCICFCWRTTASVWLFSFNLWNLKHFTEQVNTEAEAQACGWDGCAAASTLCDQRQAGNAEEHSWLSILACYKQMSDVQGTKVLMHEEARLKYIYITILVSEYANCIPLGRRNGKVCTRRALLVL